MMKRKHKRLTFVVIALCLFSTAAGLILMALEDNIIFFYSPTDLINKSPGPEQRLRLGGLVAEKSLRKIGNAVITFKVTDNTKTINVRYQGILPDLFREGQGVVTQGYYKSGVFEADEVLAKHDENYMPAEVADALKKSGQWQGSGKAAMGKIKW